MKHFVVAASRQSAANSKSFQSAVFCRKPLQLLRAICCLGLLLLVFFGLPIFAQTNDLPALVPAYPEIPPTFWEQHGTLVIIGAFVFLTVAAVVAWEIFRPKPAPVLPPEKIARDALARLQAQPEDGKLLSEVSQILRRYFGAVFQMPGAELTTAEFSTALSVSEKISTELAGAIAAFLRECDKRKFSPPGAVGVQASACSESPPAPLDTRKRELQPTAARALEIVSLVEKETHRQDACATPK